MLLVYLHHFAYGAVIRPMAVAVDALAYVYF